MLQNSPGDQPIGGILSFYVIHWCAMPMQREARFAELRREELQQQQVQAAEAMQREVLELQEQAARNLVGHLGQAEDEASRGPANATSAAPTPATPGATVGAAGEPGRGDGAKARPSGRSEGIVEADYVMERPRQPGHYQQDVLKSEMSRWDASDDVVAGAGCGCGWRHCCGFSPSL